MPTRKLPPRRSRRRQESPPSLSIESSLTPYHSLTRRWVLRILIDLGLHQSVLHDGFCSSSDILKHVGFEPPGIDDDYDRERAFAALKTMHRAAMREPNDWAAASPAQANLRWLREQVGLGELDTRLLLLCVLGRSCHPLGRALEMLEGLSDLKLTAMLCTLLEASPEEVEATLRRDGALARTGLARLDSKADYTFLSKIDLLAGISDRLLVAHAHCFDIFAGNFVQVPEATLRVEQYEHLQPKLAYLLAYLRHSLQTAQAGSNVLIYGPPGVGKSQLVRTLAHELQAHLFEVATATADGQDIRGDQRLLAYLASQQVLARRGRTMILFDEIEDIDECISQEDNPFAGRRGGGRKAWFNQVLEGNPVPSIWVSNRIRQIDPSHRRRFDFHLEVDVPPVPVRTRMLESEVLSLGASPAWCARVANHPGLGPALIARTAKVSQAVMQSQPPEKAEAVLEALLAGSLDALGQPPLERQKASEVMDYDASLIATSIDPVHLVQGLRSAEGGRLCFYGPPGTGKSALALHIARELGRPAVLKRASDLFSSFHGESERLIAEAFTEARERNAVLIVDEADAFLGSRKRAQHNWELSLVNEFLQQLEAFNRGVFVATTNLMRLMDEASFRRFDLKVEFRYMRPAQVQTLLSRACERLGLPAPEATQALTGLERLTPGDFAAVMRQARFNPVRDAADLTQRLREELRHSQGEARAIGFTAGLG